MFQSSNPTLSAEKFSGWRENGMSLAPTRSDVMTVQGAINASMIMTSVCIASAIASGTLLASQPGLAMIGFIAALIGTFVIGLVLFFKPLWAKVLGLPFAVFEGVFVGLVSVWAMSAMAGTAVGGTNGSGVVFAAAAATLGLLVTMLAAYKSNIVRATPMFKKVMLISFLGLAAFSFATFIASLFGADLSVVYGNGPIAILITVAFLVFGAFKLVLDFDLIETGAASGAPKAMEWYAGYALLTTVVFIYIEILRLIIQLTGRRE